MMQQIKLITYLASVSLVVALAATSQAQDYDGEGGTEISGLSGLGGLSGLSALANAGVVTGYAPASEGSDNSEGYQGGERGLGASESSEADGGDYEDDSNDSSASEEHPILSKFINLISGGRHKRSIDNSEAPVKPAVAETKTVHSRVKRGYKGWVPYVSTYVKTDKKAHFKWGVKAKVGKKYGK